MEVQEAIASRRSIRSYATTSIPPDHLALLLRALQLAPSANNGQNWEFIFVSDPELKHGLVSACFNQQFIHDCAYFIAGVANPGLKWHMVDITIALTNFALQAVELGYGTCWIGAFDEPQVKAILKVPAEKKVVICMSFGKPQGRHLSRGRKALADFIYRNQYGQKLAHQSASEEI